MEPVLRYSNADKPFSPATLRLVTALLGIGPFATQTPRLVFLLFRADELDRAGCFFVEVVASKEVAINRDVATYFSAGHEKWLHDDCALILIEEIKLVLRD
jgi:hypothetical protein